MSAQLESFVTLRDVPNGNVPKMSVGLKSCVTFRRYSQSECSQSEFSIGMLCDLLGNVPNGNVPKVSAWLEARLIHHFSMWVLQLPSDHRHISRLAFN